MTTFALVLETNNLTGGGADAARTAQSLERLLARLREQTRPLAVLDEFVITHDGLPSGARARLDAVAGKPIRWVELDGDIDYYEAKNRGFDATTTDVVAFADADCWPEPKWLEELFAPFDEAAVAVTAGRTTYRTDILGTAASTIDFMYFDSPLGSGCTRNFYANNVAFRRAAFGARRYATHDMYRGHCQVLGARLHAEGVKVIFVPAARTIHRFPDSIAELVKLRLLRGEDVISLAPHLVRTYAPFAAPLNKLGPVVPLAVLAARFGFSVASINKQDMPPAHGARWLGVVGAIAGISLVDAVGTVARTLGWRPGSRGVSSAKVTLSYHRDGDQLHAAHPVAA
ncbi:MAG TPA: glycosyltransferase [Kofleriaceae bacterium]|nr:glycosyltransferase [Kofleriaceae bacterium]